MNTAGRQLLARICGDLGIDPSILEHVPDPAHPVPLPSRLATADLAWASVTAASILSRPTEPALAAPDPDRIAAAYRSLRFFHLDGEAPPAWAPLSGFWRAADGWIRTHGNYPHHARALRSALGLEDAAGAERVREAVAVMSAAECVDRISRAGGLAVRVLEEDPARDVALRAQPLISLQLIGEHAASRRMPPEMTAPLRGIRVLDLTRVIAGPVCTRTLALLGADVLRIDPPNLPELERQHLDTGHGKRSALLDARSEHMHRLLDAADVIVLGYHPSALDRLGLAPDRLSAKYPGIVVAQLSAWGTDNPSRRGFDSLVQAESGIALAESDDGASPGVLPAQALDHSAGYLLAAGVCAAIECRAREGGTWLVSTSLRRVAAELLGMPRADVPAAERKVNPAGHTQEFTVGGRTLATAAAALPGFTYAAPRPWAGDEPAW